MTIQHLNKRNINVKKDIDERAKCPHADFALTIVGSSFCTESCKCFLFEDFNQVVCGYPHNVQKDITELLEELK